MKTLLIAAVFSFCTLFSATASADPLAKVNDAFATIDSAVKRLEETVASASKITMGKRHDDMQRLVNGIYLLKNDRPQDAAALFLSLVQHPSLGKEATFYLSEAMYKSANYQVAAEYYWMVVEQRWDPVFRSKAIKRLLEISIRTQNYQGIDKLLALVEQMPEMKDSPEVAYARGKYAYYLAHEEFAKPVAQRREAWAMEKFLEALRFFDSIRPVEGKDGKKEFPALYPQAVYFAGATLVRMSQVGTTSFVRDGKVIDLTQFTTSLSEMREMLLFEAVRRFSILASDTTMHKWLDRVPASAGMSTEIKYFEPRNEEEKQIRELACLALGRIFYELGETGESIRWYRMIGEKSEHYEDALYEMVWVYVRQEEFIKATETLAIMEARNRNSVFLPRARLLLGYLQVRNEKWDEARRDFESTASRYRGVHQQVQELLSKDLDLKIFFDQVMRRKENSSSGNEKKNSVKVPFKYAIPQEALPLFQDDPVLMKAALVAEDISEIRQNLEESRENLLMIKRRLKSSSKIGLFPLLSDSRAKSYELEGQTMDARAELLKVASERFAKYAVGDAALKLKKAQEKRQAMEKAVATLPKTSDSLAGRLASKRKVYDQKIMEVDNLIKDLNGYQEIIAGMFEYYRKQKPARQAKLAPYLEQLQKESGEVDAALEVARNVRARILDASLNVGVDDADMEEEHGTRSQYREAIAAEFAVWTSLRSSFSASDAALYDRMAALMQNAGSFDARLDELNRRLQALADERLAKIQEDVKVEEANLAAYEIRYQQYREQAGVLNKDISRESIQAVAKRFWDVVVESELGLADVQWSLRAKTRKEWSRLNDRNKLITSEMKTRYQAVDESGVEFDAKRYADPFEVQEETGNDKGKTAPSPEKPAPPKAGGNPQ